MKKRTKLICAALFLVVCMSLTGCGSRLGEHTSQYFSSIASRVSTLTGGTATASADEEEEGTALETPGDFTVEEDGSYSFSSVENASYYIIYMYDANGDDSDGYLQISSNIAEDGSGTYTGSLSDSMTYGYGDFRIEVVAYPEVTDEEYHKSESASCEFMVSGAVEEPTYAYLWDCLTGTLKIQMTSIGAYEYTAYPELVEVVLTNEADSSDTITISMEDLTLINDAYILSTTDVTPDATYSIVATATWDETCVTNPSAETEVGSVTVSSSLSTVSWGYGYCDDSIYSFLDYPMSAENFDLAAGGSVGAWYSFTPYSETGYSVQNAEHTATWQEESSQYFTATPTDTTEGSAYTYTIEVAASTGNAIYMSDFGSLTEMEGAITGTLEIYEDGTFLMTLDLREIVYIEAKGSSLYFTGSHIEGVWTDNGDGTINLVYDHSTTVLDE